MKEVKLLSVSQSASKSYTTGVNLHKIRHMMNIAGFLLDGIFFVISFDHQRH